MTTPKQLGLAIVYFGTTRVGKRIHLGEDLLSRTGPDKQKTVYVYAYCGALVLSYEEGNMPNPKLASTFCMGCFRSMAWEVFLTEMNRRADAA